MKRYLLLCLLCICVLTGSINAQLTGVKNIPGNYATLALAIQDLNTQGVGAGGVVFNMLAPETAPAGGYSITATGTAANTITLVGNNNVITASASLASGALNDALFKIIGGDFISIGGFQMQENAANTTTTTGTNNMTEWGVALLYANTTNGAQNNSIVGNTISLNRTYSNTFGIYSNTRHTATSISTTADVTSPTGSNSNNKVWGNTISNVNMGISFIGSGVAANQDVANDVGGTSVTTGNIITNWGGAAAGSSYISNSGTSYCIFMNHQTAFNVSYNTITSAAVTPTVTFRGIVQDYTATAPTGTFTNTISFNTITMNSAQTSGTFRVIDAASGVSTMTLNITNNTILNCSITGVLSTSLFGGIFNSGAISTLNINNNILQGNTSSAGSGGFTGIQNSGAVTGAINLNNNQIGNLTGGAIVFSATCTGAVQGIINTGGATGSTLTIQGNDFCGIVHNVVASSAHTYVSNSSVNPNTNLNNNTFTNLNVNTTGNVTFISNNVTHAANTVHNVNNNSVVTAFNKTASGGTIAFYNSFSTSLTTIIETNTGNNFSNMTFNNPTLFLGWRCGDGSTVAPFGSNKTVTNNTFTNITASGTNAMTILEVDYSNSNSTTNNVSGNLVSNISGGGGVIGIISNEGNQNFFNNTVNGLVSSGSNIMTGIYVTGGATQNIFRNKIYDLVVNNAGGTVQGIRTTNGVTATVYNNLIGDLRAPITNNPNAVIGIFFNGGTNANAYYNTIYLNAASSATDFGSTGISVLTSVSVDLRNNLVVNLSTPNGIGVTAAYRRSSATLTSYAVTSNNNSFYAGTPSANHLIFYDGTNSDQTLAAYKTRVAPRDAASFSENPAFASIIGSSAVFLHIPAATATFLESGGTPIPSVTTIDYDSDNRPGPTGSVNGGALAPDIGADEFDGILGCMGTPLAGTQNISPASVCVSGTFTLSLIGASSEYGITYQWQESSVTSGPYTNIPGANSVTYSTPTISSTMYYVCVVTCTGSGLTATSAEFAAIVNPLPVVTANSSAAAVCNGSSVTLTGSGATSYSWTGGVTDGVAFIPTVTDTYTVTGTDGNGCQNTDMITVTVNPLPTVTANASATAVCNGFSVTLTGGGATSYSWTGGVTDGIAFIPTVTDTYTVTGTDGNGCINTQSVSVTVNPLPTVTANSTASAVCNGSSVTLTGGGATSYSWTGGVTDGVAFIPTVTDTYTVTGTDGNGCINTQSVSVTVNPLPIVTVSLPQDTACLNGGIVNLSGESPSGGTWSGTGVSGNTFDPLVFGVGMAPITYSYSDINGCSASAVDSIWVDVCNGISLVIANNDLSLFPNPTTGQFTIQLSAAPTAPLQIELLNELGQRLDVFVMTDAVRQMDIGNLEGGVYFIRTISGNAVHVYRLVKQ